LTVDCESEAAHGLECLRILCAQGAAVQIQGSLELPLGLRKQAEVQVGLANGVTNGGFHFRLLLKPAANAGGGAV
jgi:hypothetical protein